MSGTDTTFEDYRPLLLESCSSLGYLRTDLQDSVLNRLYCPFGESSAVVARAFRNAGRQLTADQKRAAGINLNALVTHEALAALTDKGRADPVWALELTVRRAAFGLMRLVHARLIVENATMLGTEPLTRLSGKAPECEGSIPDTIFSTPWQALATLPLVGCKCQACVVMPRAIIPDEI